MLFISQRETEGWFDIKSIKNFKCEDLREIDQYWKKYSKEGSGFSRFGFSVQKSIYNKLNKNLSDFGEDVGWYEKQRNWINHQYSNISPQSPIFEKYAPKGHLPFLEDGKNWVGPYIISNRCTNTYQTDKNVIVTECQTVLEIRISTLYSRLEKCKL